MWMVVDERGRFVTQREAPALATVETAIDEETIVLSHRTRAEIRLPLAPTSPAERTVRVWDHEGPAHDCGDEVGAWFSGLLDRQVRVVRMPDEHHRQVGSAYSGRARTAFSDGYPILVISEASLAALNERLARPVPMNRFRPNLVIAGTDPHAEDAWERVRIGEVSLLAVKPCARCVVTTVDQSTGERGKEPLRTLGDYRRRPEGVMFGQNLVHLSTGRMRVGELVETEPGHELNPGAGRRSP
jgi:hypothetical protein